MAVRYAWHLLEGDALHATAHPTVIAAVHGLEASWRAWEPLARHLPSGTRLYALDLPWRAGNDYRWWHSAADAPQHLERALQILPEHPDTLVAHSFGANAALAYLTRSLPQASRLRAAMLAAPCFRPADCPADRAVFARHRENLRLLMAEGVRSRLGPRARDMEEAVLTSMERAAVARLNPQALQVLFDSYRASGTLDLSAVRIPVLVAVGAADPAAEVRQGRALAGGLPTATLHVHPRAGHFLTHQAPGPFAADITALLTAHATNQTVPPTAQGPRPQAQ
ncbi:hypothetical protein ADL21_02200 [Streptomyces albus subsp. albus]|nr:hypothetical protein ADL21_02200 [Streptomyces albus subsp. albus]